MFYSIRNDGASNATYTQASLSLGLSVEECLKLAALFKAHLDRCQITTAPLQQPLLPRKVDHAG